MKILFNLSLIFQSIRKKFNYKSLSFIREKIRLLFPAFIFMIYSRCSLNRENLDYVSSTPQITATEIKHSQPNSIIIFIKPGCPGTPRYAPKIKNELNLLKTREIPYFLIAEVLYDENVDERIKNFKQQYGYENETIYLMNVKKYPEDNSLFYQRKRIRDFLNDICQKCDTLPYGPGLHVFLKDGKFAKAKLTYELQPEDLDIYKEQPGE